MNNKLFVRGARTNNLRDINVVIPKNKLVVITGLSGSGKSSLAFDTIFAEGQRRYVESLSSYARQFLELQDKPDVDEIKGLTPTIAINQRGLSENPRSTVGTVTEIADYMRLLFARIGRPTCLVCDIALSKASSEEIVRNLNALVKKHSIRIYAPVVRPKEEKSTNGDRSDLTARLILAGFSEVRLNGILTPLRELAQTGLPLEDFTLDVLIGTYGPQDIERDPEYVRMQILTALELGDGTIAADTTDGKQKFFFSKDLTCPKCGNVSPPLEPRNFSFNSPRGACPGCSGLGVKSIVLPELVIPNPRLSLAQGAIRPWTRIGANQATRLELLKVTAIANNFSIDIPVGQLNKKAREIVLFGSGEKKYDIKGTHQIFQGIIPELESRYAGTDSDYIRKEIETYMRKETCPDCQGTRINKQARAVTFIKKTISEINETPIEDLIQFFNIVADPKNPYKLSETDILISSPILKEILIRLNNLKNAGLNYLTLDRSAPELSGGEGQRVRLAVQLSTTLSGIIYVLDEPTVGLHERDTQMLLNLLKQLLLNENTIIVVEHDPRVMKEADWIIDMGPGAGTEGGLIVAEGTLSTINKTKDSLTAAYLTGKRKIKIDHKPRKGNGKSILIKGASAFNLKEVNVKIPLGKFVCVTGVSGSGKSTLILDILAKKLANKLHYAYDLPQAHKEITGIKNIDKVITIDQTPIGRTPRSNPATYTGIFSIIRDLYTEVPEAKLKGFDAGKFSFNVKGGRCEACAGEGYTKVPMQFMAETFIVCAECHGTRYRPEALEIHYHGKNIADVLQMSASEAKKFFKDVPLLHEKLQVLDDVGLGYIKLGQPAPTLSGGEAQRVKLSTELSRRATGKTLYILDEPTTGLHFQDIEHLLVVLHRLVDKGNSVIVIEHNMDVIKTADWVIDLGPEGGDKGGEILVAGTPADVAKNKRSYTGKYLKESLK